MQGIDVVATLKVSRSLQMIAEQGADIFYNGRLGALLLQDVIKGGGSWAQEDLSSYHAIERATVVTEYQNYTVIGSTPVGGNDNMIDLLITCQLDYWCLSC